MSDRQRRRAEYLYDELGNIDEKYIAEAQNYRTRRHTRAKSVLLAAAACLLLVALTALLPLARPGNESGNNPQKPGDYASPSDTAPLNPAPITLSDALISCRTHESGAAKTGMPDLFDGKARLIWKYADSEDVYYITLTDTQLNRLGGSTGGRQISGDGGDASVWIAYGNGTVISPCLKPSAGNIGYGALFDYSPELEPDIAYTAYVCGIITGST